MMTQEANSVLERQFTCIIQAKHGALDKVLGTLTHRGFIPTYFSATLVDACLGSATPCQEVTIRYADPDDWGYQKLLKSLEKQVWVLSVQDVSNTAPLQSV